MNLDPWVYVALFFSGLGAGFVDAVAGGGGLIAVPMLLWAGLPPRLALGTNKLQSSCGTALAAWHYGRAGLLRWRSLKAGLLITFVAALLGAHAVSLLDPGLLRACIPPVLIGLAIWFWWQPQLGLAPRPARMNATAFAWLAGSVLGFYDGFFGPGTGSFWMIACILLLGLDLRMATGHTKAMNLASNLAALCIFMFTKNVRYDVGLVMIGGQLVGARLGSGFVIARGTAFIRPIFLGVVLALAARLIWLNLRA